MISHSKALCVCVCVQPEREGLYDDALLRHFNGSSNCLIVQRTQYLNINSSNNHVVQHAGYGFSIWGRLKGNGFTLGWYTAATAIWCIVDGAISIVTLAAEANNDDNPFATYYLMCALWSMFDS